MNRLARAALAASLFVATSATAGFAMGLSEPPPPAAHRSSSGSNSAGHLSKDVAEPLSLAQKAATAGDLQTALSEIKQAQAATDRTPHDDFVINQFLSSVAANLKDYPTAAGAYDALIAAPEFAAMSDADKMPIVHDGLVVSENLQRWQTVVAYGQQLETLKGNDASTYAGLAIAYYNLKDIPNAQIYAQKSVDMAKAAGKQPEEAAMEIIMNGQAKNNNQAAALETLETLAVNYNQPTSWQQLTEVALGSRGLKTLDALYIYRLRFMAGAMSQPDDYTVMASVANQLGYPTEAAHVLQQGMSSGKLSAGQAGPELSKARNGAANDERALPDIAAKAEKSKTGEQDAKLAEDYWGYGRYADAETAARRAISKGGLKDPSEGALILGMSLVAQDKDDDAVQTLSQVTGTEGHAKAAHLWSLRAQAKKKQGGAAPAATH